MVSEGGEKHDVRIFTMQSIGHRHTCTYTCQRLYIYIYYIAGPVVAYVHTTCSVLSDIVQGSSYTHHITKVQWVAGPFSYSVHHSVFTLQMCNYYSFVL